MAISDQISRIQSARDIIREKEKGMGIVSSTESPNLTLLAERLNNITVIDNLDHEIDGLDGQYVLEAGYYKGGTISVKGSTGDYKLASPGTNGVITPSTSAQEFNPSTYSAYGFSKFTVAKVPKKFGDITTLTTFTTSDKLFSGEQAIVKTTGADNQLEAVRITGTMTDNGNVTSTLSRTQTFYTIPKGYHAGSGQVTISLEAEKTATLGTSESTIQPANGKLLSTVKIPSVSTFLTGKVTATAADVLSGKKFVDKDGNQVAGTMPNIGNVSVALTNTNKYYDIPEGYHAGGSRVGVAGDFIGSDITRQAAKTITPIKSAQTAVAANVYTTGEITVGAIPSNYQDNTMLENNLDGISDKLYVVGSDGTAKYGTATTRSGEIAWDYTTSGSTFYLPTGIYQNSDGGTVSSYSVTFDTDGDGELDVDWAEVTLRDENYNWISPLPEKDKSGNYYYRAYIIPVEGNGYIKSIGDYYTTYDDNGYLMFGVLLYQGTLYLTDYQEMPSGTSFNSVQITNLVYEKSPAYINFNALESALAAI